MISTTHVMLKCNGEPISLPADGLIVGQSDHAWVSYVGCDTVWYVSESPAEIRALIEAADVEKWRREIAASVIGHLSAAECEASMDALSREALMYAESIIAAAKAWKP